MRIPPVASTAPWTAAVVGALGLLFGGVDAQGPPRAVSAADPIRLARLADGLARNLAYVPGELVVTFSEHAPQSARRSALGALGSAAASSRQAVQVGAAVLVTGLPPDDMEQAAFVLRQQPEVIHAEPNYLHHLDSIPSDSQYSRQWNFDQIRMPAAWDLSRTKGQGVTVAVVDSGFTQYDGALSFQLPELPEGEIYGTYALPFSRPADFDHARVLEGVEFTPTGPWSVGERGPGLLFDAIGHGTHVAAIVAQQTDNAFGFAGIANRASLLPIKACFGVMDWVLVWGALREYPGTLEEGCDTVSEAEALYYAADNGVKIVNLSLGGISPSSLVREALRYAVSKGVFVAISAGNAGLAGNAPRYPAAYAADLEGVVAVGATTPRKTRATYSNYGSYLELVAPGGEGPSGCGTPNADQVWQMAPDESALNAIPPRFDRYLEVPKCGTSMAAPHVSGAAALLYSQGITNPAAIEAALEQFAEDLGGPGRDSEFGYGLIDVRAALRGLGLAR